MLDFKVFDRWGNLLFENTGFYTNDPAQGWDGRARGKALPGGVYYFSASIRFLDDEVVMLRGEVDVIK